VIGGGLNHALARGNRPGNTGGAAAPPLPLPPH
jgi:hypothetical protein